MQVPIISGIFSDANAEFRTAYPRNLVAVPKPQGVSQGYMRPADGIAPFATGQGLDRGAIKWDGKCYRVSGTKLIRVDEDGAVVVLGEVGAGGQASMDYSFDRLAVAAGGKLFYWNGSSFVQVTDPDIGNVLDVIWIDGYFMTHDGTSIVITELADPTAVNPLRYGSSEVDPDPIMRLFRIRGEVHVVNRHTIEVFDNIGGTGFPFQRIDGAQVPKGAVGRYACCMFNDTVAMIGGGRNEGLAVYMALNGGVGRISTREIDTLLEGYSESDLAEAVLESRVDKGHQQLLMHLPDRTLVYDAAASDIVKEPVWYSHDSGGLEPSTYRARNLVRCYNRWIAGDPTSSSIGKLVQDVSTHYGAAVGWELTTLMLYNEGRSGIVHELELACLTGRVAPGADPVIWTSYSHDGELWSQERPTRAGSRGQRSQRIAWRTQGQIRTMRAQRFRGTSDAFLSIARLEARIEGLDG